MVTTPVKIRQAVMCSAVIFTGAVFILKVLKRVFAAARRCDLIKIRRFYINE
jgi:hypothetical protein